MNNELERIKNEYIAFRALDCNHPETITNYRRYIERFLKTLKGEIKEIDVINYEKKISKEFSQTTLNSINPLLKNFLKWRYKDYSVRFPNLDRILKTKKALPVHEASEMLSLNEIMKIIEFEEDLFWKAFWLIYAYGGFRPVDTCRLKWSEFSWEKDGSIIIKTFIRKNKKKFYKHIPKNVAPIIKRWREMNPHDLVFPSPQKKGEHINSKTPANRLAVISQKALGRKIIPYVLRKSIATILYQDLEDDIAADQMGHDKSMKEVYARLNDDALTKRAKRVWTDKKEMPEELKEKMQTEIDELKKQMSVLLNLSTLKEAMAEIHGVKFEEIPQNENERKKLISIHAK